MGDSVEGRVQSGVEAFLRWLPRWRIGTSRARTRVCRLCLGSPVATAAGFDHTVPHAVQHALLTRMSAIVDDAVDEYTRRNLPTVHRELATSEATDASAYRPDEGLAPEFQGLEIDPEPEEGQPFLFTLAGLAQAEAPETPVAPPKIFSEEAKAALRTELELADQYSREVGTTLCLALVGHRARISDAIVRLVEPQVDELLAELSRSLELPRAR